MLLPFRSLLDPQADQLNLPLAEFLAELRLGHAQRVIRRGDSAVKLTLLRLARHNKAIAAPIREGALFGIQAQLRLALVLVWTMTGKAVVREDEADVAIELNRRRLGRSQRTLLSNDQE